MNMPLGPKFIVIDDFLASDLIEEMERHVRSNPDALQLKDFGGGSHYSALRRLWVHQDGLGPIETRFQTAVRDRFHELCTGTGIAPFELATIETEVCAQQSGSFFSKHIDTDTHEATPESHSDRMISSVYYFPVEPLGFSGGELVLYDFTAENVAATIAPRRNRLVAFPSFACHEVTPLTMAAPDIDVARWSVNCWLHRSRPIAEDRLAR